MHLTAITAFFLLLIVMALALSAFVMIARHKKKIDPTVHKKLWAAFHKVKDIPGAGAVMELDKVLDKALSLRGHTGKGVGEKLKQAERAFERELYDAVWKAHKIRNKAAHEIDFQLSDAMREKHIIALKAAITHLIGHEK